VWDLKRLADLRQHLFDPERHRNAIDVGDQTSASITDCDRGWLVPLENHEEPAVPIRDNVFRVGTGGDGDIGDI
jgi:hypothetical protein